MMNYYLMALILCLIQLPFKGVAAIYGEDDRIDYYEMSDEIKELGRSTAVMVLSKEYKKNKKSFDFLAPDLTLKKYYNLTENSRFAHQTTQGYCSGALVSRNQILTAHHCVADGLSNKLFIFDYIVTDPSHVGVMSHPKANVYKAVQMKGEFKSGDGWVLVTLDRNVTDRVPLKIKDDNDVSIGNDVFTLHYPSGLPLKYSDDARILDLSENFLNTIGTSFTHRLDTFQGSSGAPIFNAKTKEIMGILLFGEKDYVMALNPFKKKAKKFRSKRKSEVALSVNESFMAKKLN